MSLYFSFIRRLIAGFGLILLLIPSLVLALPEPGAIEVTGQLTLTAKDYYLTGLSVRPGGQLIIKPGAHFYLAENALVEIDGILIVEGTAERPIIFEGQVGKFWQQFSVSSQSPEVRLANLRLERFQLPLTILSVSFSVNHLLLKDGVQNSLVIGNREKSYPSKNFEDLVLENTLFPGVGSQMQITVRGDYPKLSFKNITFRDFLPEDWGINFPQVRIEGNVAKAEFSQLRFPGNCLSQTREFIVGELWVLGPNLKTCQSRQIPLIFIPGYATSLHPAVLANPESKEINLYGWRFLNLLTPAYGQFLEKVRDYKISYEIAYYDWRLPAAEAARRYLEPVIEAAKQKYQVNKVYLVAHSFGGLVARAYLQGDRYAGDVAQLIQEGTPNQGAAKAYSVWEAAELPPDWQALSHLLSYYHHRSKKPTRLQTLHQFFPSAQELLPIYPAIFQNHNARKPEEFIYQNHFLLNLLADQEKLFSRTKVTTILSSSESTREKYLVEPTRDDELWRDGQPSAIQPALEKVGDGTVPKQSVLLPSAEVLELDGLHAQLPKRAAELVLKKLYPNLIIKNEPIIFPILKPVLSFFFDCPIDVIITLPDGRSRTSTSPDASSLSYSEKEQVGEVVGNEDFLWMLFRELPGTYEVSIKARADTEVRGWVGEGPPRVQQLKKDQKVSWIYRSGEAGYQENPFPKSVLPSITPAVSQPEPEKSFYLSFPNFPPETSGVNQLNRISTILFPLKSTTNLASFRFSFEPIITNPFPPLIKKPPPKADGAAKKKPLLLGSSVLLLIFFWLFRQRRE